MPRHDSSLAQQRAAAIVTLLGLASLTIALPARSLQSDQRQLSFANLEYQGAFRLPAAQSADNSFAGGGQAIAFNPAARSLFVSSSAGRVAEVTIPATAVSSDWNELPIASYLQGFADPTEGRLREVGTSGVLLSSLLVQNGRLYGTASIYYDAVNGQRFSHFSRSLRLSERSFQGWTRVWDAGMTGYVAGLLAAVPVEWQSSLGGSMISGQCCVPIVSRTSLGPAAFAFDPAAIGQATVPASPLLYYTLQHPTLGSWDGKAANPTYNSSTWVGGLVLIAGTRTALYFGNSGLSEPCYGKGTSERSLHGKADPSDGGHWCYDPTSMYKGPHAYPYRYQIWAYDLKDFAAVKARNKRPWEPVPYGVWPLEFPTPEPRTSMGGVGYDPVRQTIYVAQLHADREGAESRPLIHAFQVR